MITLRCGMCSYVISVAENDPYDSIVKCRTGIIRKGCLVGALSCVLSLEY